MQIHDHAAEFLTFWHNVEHEPVDAQVAAFHDVVVPMFPAYYNYIINDWRKNGRDSDQEIAKQLSEFSSVETRYTAKLQEFTSLLDNSIQSFCSHFGDFKVDELEVYVVHSMGFMDGGTRELDGKFYFIFGIDCMAKGHTGWSSERAFFHHELLHVYHNQYFSTEPWEYIWKPIWAEGLAVYVAKQLNPTASVAELLLNYPAGMVDDIERNALRHWLDLQSKLSSSSDADYETYFLTSSTNTDIVIRAGYYLGYLLVQQVSKSMTTSQMIQLKAEHVLPLLQIAVSSRIADSAPTPA